MIYKCGVALILAGFALTGVSAVFEGDLKSASTAFLFLACNAIIFLWRN